MFLPFATVTRRRGAFAAFIGSSLGFLRLGRVAVVLEQGNDFGKERCQSAFVFAAVADLRRRRARYDTLHGGLLGRHVLGVNDGVVFFVAFVAGTQAVAWRRCGVIVDFVIALARDVVVRRVQVGIRHEDDFDFIALFDLPDSRAFFVKQVGGDAHWQFAGDALGAVFHRFFFDEAQQRECHGLDTTD